MPASFDRIARPYRWLEYLSFGPMLEKCRFHRIPELKNAGRALVLGDGDGRFLAQLLKANPTLEADAVDGSLAMLRLLEKRVAAIEASHRLHTFHINALSFQPQGIYDLVITHFFLDCLSEEQVKTLAEIIRPHLGTDATWVVSEFAIPQGTAALPARAIIAALYKAFSCITGLRTQKLPDYAKQLQAAELRLENRKQFLKGLLVSEQWKLTR